MARIKVLDEQLANQIAAGEVVERPSSVVKELVENAVDAGSTSIDVTIEEGGLSLIRVVDNGGGIEGDDLPTAFQRHATSKIATSSDLFRIASLGFRGEALPSIAAVSRLNCVSATDDSGLARRLVIDGGTTTSVEPANAPQGTDMTIRDLFYNTPARLKYMKSIQTELGHISDYMNRVALAHPGIAITLKHNGSVLLRTLGTGDRLQVIAAVYGTSVAKAMLPISASDADYELTGYISKPELTRANRNGITVVVNGRYIRSHAVNQSLLQGYHTLLPINRFPLAVIEIGMHPGLLDVNVHPSKMEVRFSKETELRALIERAVKTELGGMRHIPGPSSGARREREGPAYVQDTISFHIKNRLEESNEELTEQHPLPEPPPIPLPLDPTVTPNEQPAAIIEESHLLSGESSEDHYDTGLTKPNVAKLPNVQGGSSAPQRAGRYDSGSLERTWNDRDTTYVPKDATERLYARPSASGDSVSAVREPAAASQVSDDRQRLLSDGKFPELHWIGQHHGTYIVAQSDEGLYLIDQHAAHERINYEYYLHKFGNPVAASQGLIVPLTLEFTAGEASQLRECISLFAEAGVEVEPFGTQTFLVRSYPEWFPQGDEQALLEEMADLLIEERKSINITKLREKAAIMCSCKASIKANDRLTREEGDALLARLSRCNQPYTCPHGRPIIVHLSTYQLEKMFKRVMS
ncbi:DNA mismatch repair endonuclease MutL [Paenibacillus sp. strain BS8-2]